MNVTTSHFISTPYESLFPLRETRRLFILKYVYIAFFIPESVTKTFSKVNKML